MKRHCYQVMCEAYNNSTLVGKFDCSVDCSEQLTPESLREVRKDLMNKLSIYTKNGCNSVVITSIFYFGYLEK